MVLVVGFFGVLLVGYLSIPWLAVVGNRLGMSLAVTPNFHKTLLVSWLDTILAFSGSKFAGFEG